MGRGALRGMSRKGCWTGATLFACAKAPRPPSHSASHSASHMPFGRKVFLTQCVRNGKENLRWRFSGENGRSPQPRGPSGAQGGRRAVMCAHKKPRPHRCTGTVKAGSAARRPFPRWGGGLHAACRDSEACEAGGTQIGHQGCRTCFKVDAVEAGGVGPVQLQDGEGQIGALFG
ncbi:hypothetical protein PSJ8397_02642 [Pseudooctadecabacter jejudonensis]|uniref:Uncharacterized protein n=1 Tax=Pseudooctadecabacter jejudonensis TaxID=1391910 RepID=A0A1Y5SWW3_9RHOB|nr:hypothetical protein PSJ8397_02642 [Pseudooctadecabacter jejudonensis]